MRQDRPEYDLSDDEQRLSSFLTPILRYLALLTGLLAAGMLGLYALSQSGLLGSPARSLLAGAVSALIIALAQLPFMWIAKQGRGSLAFSLFALSLSLWSLYLTLIWESAWPVGLMMAWIATLAAAAARTSRGRIAVALLAIVTSGGVLALNARPPFARLPADNAAGTAAVILLASTLLLFVLGTIIVRLIRYRSLQSRLVVSFILIITVPILVTTAVSAVTASRNSQQQFSDSLQAITSLKQGQIDSIVQTMAVEMSRLQQGSGSGASILQVLERGDQTDETYRINASVASTLLRDIIVQYPASHYEEILILDKSGKIILSTYKPGEGDSFANEAFFAEGSRGFFAELSKYPGKQNLAGEYKLVVAAPVYGAGPQDIHGTVVAVAKSDLVFAALGPTSGLANAHTYLVDSHFRLVSNIPDTQVVVSALPLVHLILSKAPQGSKTYQSQGQAVLGYGAWDPAINAAIVSEIPRNELVTKSLAALYLGLLVGLFSIVVAVIAALSTSRAVSEPIGRLAKAADRLASGELGARAVAEQQRDEVGALADSFNSMAEQLQGTIGNLEQRIAERTEALEQQSLRLRAAAEVARDAAYASNLDQLLDDAARLIRDRFDLYHTGIFLVDEKHEYAVLRASPSDAGKQMLANGHRLRVGEQGIVGRVAATGEPRIALDTGIDPVFFSNPLLPKTHSEMALPLKTADGTIGAIDIQSDQPEAFTQDDIAIVQVMADQLATAIQKARLLQQVRTQLDQLERSYQAFTEKSWKTFGQTGRQTLGYRFDNVRMQTIKSTTDLIRPRDASVAPSDSQTIDVPIRLRGQTIGTVNIRFQSSHVPSVTRDMIDQIADRLATALENARLLEESVRQANKERAIGEITAKISASVNMRNVLQTAVEELGRAIPGSDVLLQFQAESEV